MARTNPEARQRLVATAADMLRRRGMNATSIRELAKAAKAPLGSTYHYFPEGKKQVVLEAVEFAGNRVTELIIQAFKHGPIAGLDAFLAMWRKIIEQSEFNAGCPVLAVAMEEAINEEIEAAHLLASKVFDSWQSLLAESLSEHGVEKSEADQLATLFIASAEGAIAMCRAQKRIEPFDQVTAQLKKILESAIPG
ncbi:TetR/AcrR family transcriptional regulator [Litoribrevibacter albus]|uniref:TetR-family transcriptional regulator n=1 Tax=Litoribrevibacter albus TaxID=1473156 RepID=A0AA37S9V9_9GAMM|nr:TetR/AcrR family transcriptional regulator [Litoribrevibacter albus]GLQ30737.1 putative TetR-family transcriptional regulator [Litoribrevibacter albus]